MSPEFTAFMNINSSAYNTTEASADTMMPIACSFNRLYIQFRQADFAHNYTFTLRKNSADTALTCALTSSTSGTVTCSDTSHAVAVVATDQVTIKIVDTTGGTTPTGQVLFGVVCQ